ncbi:MAG: aminotransferase class I/II-fold pyridoxal phosphate-dependent enzyme [Acidimicrobiales bacterium]|nr:aminotransferase class I/II-fold pyridoxal phosphate-dependent enzyme [Acidimicrobiales bacterium]MDG1875963.1 aminotransferase class I/II-fold pyridoxal phosphate-dependent enzyme [Acidimicrobiales bacterium]
MSQIERLRSTLGHKWTKHGPDVLPAFVADMDFPPDPRIGAAISELLDRDDLGYLFHHLDQLPEVWEGWMKRRHGVDLDIERMWNFTGALHAVEAVLQLMTEPGDGIVIFTPVYHVFQKVIEGGARVVVGVPLAPDGSFDPDDLARACDEARPKAILMSQPHNPTGRVTTAAELAAIADVAERHDLIVFSDEVWADLTLAPHRHLPTVSEARLADRTITIGAVSKAFNLAGLSCAMAHFGHEPTQAAFEAAPDHLIGRPSSLSAAGVFTAWTECEDWLEATCRQIAVNAAHLGQRLEVEAPHVGYRPPEAGYLTWLDLRQTGLGNLPAERILEDQKLALNEGDEFGPGGAGFVRVNVATYPDILDDVIDRLVAAVSKAGRP